MNISDRERIKRFYACFNSDDRILIPINADPDAIACAWAVKRLLWRKVANVTISNVNVIERPDNLTLIRLIGITITPFKKIDPNRFNRVVMVDSQPDHHETLSKMKPHVIIDHHPVGPTIHPCYCDIRPKYGATASILVEYLRAARIKPSVKLATALYFAIKTDTSDFERQTLIEDINAFQYVFRLSNITLARRIEHAEFRMDYLAYFRRALSELRVRKGRGFVHLGQVHHPDVCVQIADFLMRIDKVNWSIVSGLYQDKIVVIFRNDGIRKDAGSAAKKAFGQFGSAGGHKSAARAEVRLDVLGGQIDPKDQVKLIRWITKQLEL
jgi:nanoRNase/pAp phosphatase (c-di-AMP/oligoRNAs hydrolase)